QAADMLRPVAERSSVEIRSRAEHCVVWADPDRLTQTLVNLIGNAVKFSPAGGLVEVDVESIDGFARFSVRDYGRGIPHDKRELVFQRFQQVDNSDAREKGGSGLGLAIARSIVEQHGGRIWVESEPATGSAFRFTIPL